MPKKSKDLEPKVDDVCKTCNQKQVKKCSVCCVTYTGQSKLHLRTDRHQEYKLLFSLLRNQPQAEIKKLIEKYDEPKEEPKEGKKGPKKKASSSVSNDEVIKKS